MFGYRVGLALTLAVATLGVAVGTGCEDKRQLPPPPAPRPPLPMPLQPAAHPLLEPALPLGGRSKPVLSKATLRQHRMELCYFGVVGLEVAREAYWDSLGDEQPNADNVPNFGRYPEYMRRRGRRNEPSLSEKMGRLPFDGQVRSCASANSQKDKTHGTLVKALPPFAEYVAVVSKAVFDASRYYARDEYKRDDFKKGLELHDKLSDELAKLDQTVAQFRPAFRRWLEARPELTEASKLDAAGKLATGAVDEARRLALMLLEPSPDAAAVTAAVKAAGKASKTLSDHGKSHADAKHPKIVAPKVAALVAAAKKLATIGRELTPTERYSISSAFLEVLQANHRATIQLLRGDDHEDPFGRRAPRLVPPRRRSPHAQQPAKKPAKPTPKAK